VALIWGSLLLLGALALAAPGARSLLAVATTAPPTLEAAAPG
jgi:hypothetical protein